MASQDNMIQPNFQFHFTNLTHTIIPHHTLGLILIIIIFAIIFLSTCFYFYYHFISLYIPSSSTTTINTAAATSNNNSLSSSSPPVPQPLGLNPAAISNLPVFPHRSTAVSDVESGSCGSNSTVRESECSICLGLFEDEEIVKVLPKCQHAYHSECVDKWLSARSSCPLCRASLLVDL
ncbi:hypothetical protein RHGRI_036205 [Rhododendron griersonianum]|uniref:RING-type E3 ubiquitin transferase n=1 Tax=Rhododendron griersonianum TaxID=479676 RepID=A0AAV6HR18_9ERIC|nr:hypothetical protein RHGRI_036205 [Rhododendron griersonianum]